MVPILFVSGLCDTNTLNEARQVRPVGYLMKPFDYSGLKASVEMGLSWSSGYCQTPTPLVEYKHSSNHNGEFEHSEASVICVCSSCKSVRDIKGRWRRLERFLNQKYNLIFSHGICPDCFQDMYPELPE
jgi:response regulator RpfG family c-di-GMP phosphodiesterase